MTSSISIFAPVAIAEDCFILFVFRLNRIAVLAAVGTNFFTLSEYDLSFGWLLNDLLCEFTSAADFTIRLATRASSAGTNIGIPVQADILVQMLLTSNSSASSIIIIACVAFQLTQGSIAHDLTIRIRPFNVVFTHTRLKIIIKKNNCRELFSQVSY